MGDWVSAVSYTHLDVYKRQAFAYLALQELATRIAHYNTGKALPDGEGYAVMKLSLIHI